MLSVESNGFFIQQKIKSKTKCHSGQMINNDNFNLTNTKFSCLKIIDNGNFYITNSVLEVFLYTKNKGTLNVTDGLINNNTPLKIIDSTIVIRSTVIVKIGIDMNYSTVIINSNSELAIIFDQTNKNFISQLNNFYNVRMLFIAPNAKIRIPSINWNTGSVSLDLRSFMILPKEIVLFQCSDKCNIKNVTIDIIPSYIDGTLEITTHNVVVKIN